MSTSKHQIIHYCKFAGWFETKEAAKAFAATIADDMFVVELLTPFAVQPPKVLGYTVLGAYELKTYLAHLARITDGPAPHPPSTPQPGRAGCG